MYSLKQMIRILSFAFLAHEIFESYNFIHILTKNKLKINWILSLQRLVSTERSCVPKQSCNRKVHVCLSMYDFLVDTMR